GAGISDARQMFAFQQRHSPLRRGVTLEEIGGAALYLLSDLSTGVTGDVHFVDSGYNVIAMPHPGSLKDETAANERAIVKDSAEYRASQWAASGPFRAGPDDAVALGQIVNARRAARSGPAGRARAVTYSALAASRG